MMLPFHYAPDHNDRLPICGAGRPNDPGLYVFTDQRDRVTCLKCLDVYEERNATPEQVEALSYLRDEIDAIYDELHEEAHRREDLHLALMVTGHLLRSTPWWNLRRRFRLLRAMHLIEEQIRA